ATGVAVLALFELLGVASVFPFMALLADPEQIETNIWLARAYQLGGFTSQRNFIIATGIAVILVLLLSRALGWAISYWRDRLEWSIYLRTSYRLLQYYVNRPYRFFLGKNTADLRTYLINETMNLVQGVLVPLITIMINGGTALVIVLLLLIINPTVALITGLVLSSAYALIFWLRKDPMQRLGEQRLQTGISRNRNLEELFRGIKTVKTYGNEATFLTQYLQETTDLANINPRLRVMYQMPRFLLEVLTFTGVIGVTLVLYLRSGDLTSILPTLTLFAVAGYRLLPSLQQVFGAVATMRAFSPTLQQLKPDLLAALSYEAQTRANKRELTFRHSVMLREVTFRFPEAEKELFSRINLKVEKGQTIAFVGATGSGKTTLVDLITGLLSPTAGAIYVDDIPLDETTIQSWRQQLAYVPQHVYLYDVSLRENIRFGILGLPDDAAIMEVLDQVALGDFVRNDCPEGLDTVLGENGVRLSGGQRQRVGLARALLRRPNLLVLDEATSALDTVTEREVMMSLDNLPSGLSIIIIAHRISTVQRADVIHLVEQGKIIASGPYEQLLRESPAFRAMAKG
ncbi:MAG: ABC transporter ATP-binding protein, partial [Bacteroidota bacterium]